MWIAGVDAPMTTAQARITLTGRGFLLPSPVVQTSDAERVDVPVVAEGEEPEEPTLTEGEDAVVVGGIPARIYLRRDERIDLEVPRLSAGPHLIVVWSGGTASNAFPIRVLETTGSP